MKTPTLFFVTLLLTTWLRAQAPALEPVAFGLGLQKFAEGDAISIREVLATSPRMDVGDTVIVRGRYTLHSEARATIGLSVTQTENRQRTIVSPAANAKANRGSGDFEVKLQVAHVGCMHLTFSSLPERRSFGTVYFGTPEQLARVQGMQW